MNVRDYLLVPSVVQDVGPVVPVSVVCPVGRGLTYMPWWALRGKCAFPVLCPQHSGRLLSALHYPAWHNCRWCSFTNSRSHKYVPTTSRFATNCLAPRLSTGASSTVHFELSYFKLICMCSTPVRSSIHSVSWSGRDYPLVCPLFRMWALYCLLAWCVSRDMAWLKQYGESWEASVPSLFFIVDIVVVFRKICIILLHIIADDAYPWSSSCIDLSKQQIYLLPIARLLSYQPAHPQPFTLNDFILSWLLYMWYIGTVFETYKETNTAEGPSCVLQSK